LKNIKLRITWIIPHVLCHFMLFALFLMQDKVDSNLTLQSNNDGEKRYYNHIID